MQRCMLAVRACKAWQIATRAACSCMLQFRPGLHQDAAIGWGGADLVGTMRCRFGATSSSVTQTVHIAHENDCICRWLLCRCQKQPSWGTMMHGKESGGASRDRVITGCS